MKTQHKKNIKLQLMSANRDCEKCHAQPQCFGGKLNSDQLKLLSGIIRRHATFEAGETIFKVEDRFSPLYAIQSGAVKIQTFAYDGTNLISGFYFPGDLVGIESIGDSTYRNDAVALSTTTVCELPFDQLETLCDSIPALRHEVMMLLAHKIRHTDQTIVHGRRLHVEARLLLFLRYLCQRNGIRQHDGSERIRLPMSKGDIACYLGLCPESLSRALGKLQSEGIIRNHSKSIDLLDMETHIAMLCGNREACVDTTISETAELQ
jgi:CRP/FNR family transcriptional regulator